MYSTKLDQKFALWCGLVLYFNLVSILSSKWYVNIFWKHRGKKVLENRLKHTPVMMNKYRKGYLLKKKKFKLVLNMSY